MFTKKKWMAAELLLLLVLSYTYFLHCSNRQDLVLSFRLKGCLSLIDHKMYAVLLILINWAGPSNVWQASYGIRTV